MTSDPDFVVIDTNVLISAGLLPHSRSAQALTLAVERYVIAQNEATWGELISRIEKTKFDRYFGESGRLHYVSRLAQFIQTFPQAASVQLSRDKDDDKFIALAMDAGARLIISGDEDLTAIKTYQGIEIVTPAVFMARFES